MAIFSLTEQTAGCSPSRGGGGREGREGPSHGGGEKEEKEEPGREMGETEGPNHRGREGEEIEGPSHGGGDMGDTEGPSPNSYFLVLLHTHQLRRTAANMVWGHFEGCNSEEELTCVRGWMGGCACVDVCYGLDVFMHVYPICNQ